MQQNYTNRMETLSRLWNQNYVTALRTGVGRTKFKNKPTPSNKNVSHIQQETKKAIGENESIGAKLLPNEKIPYFLSCQLL